MPRLKVRRRSQPSSPPVSAGDSDGEDDPISFSELCRVLRNDNHLTQADLGVAFAVSAKTFARWEGRQSFPTVLQAPGVVATIAARWPEHAEDARRALGIEPPPPSPERGIASPPLRPHPAIAKAALDGAVFEAAERFGIPSARVREIAVHLFERAVLVGVSAEEAAAIVRGVMSPGS